MQSINKPSSTKRRKVIKTNVCTVNAFPADIIKEFFLIKLIKIQEENKALSVLW